MLEARSVWVLNLLYGASLARLYMLVSSYLPFLFSARAGPHFSLGELASDTVLKEGKHFFLKSTVVLFYMRVTNMGISRTAYLQNIMATYNCKGHTDTRLEYGEY